MTTRGKLNSAWPGTQRNHSKSPIILTGPTTEDTPRGAGPPRVIREDLSVLPSTTWVSLFEELWSGLVPQ